MTDDRNRIKNKLLLKVIFDTKTDILSFFEKRYLWLPLKIKDGVWLQVFLLKYFKYTRGSQEPVSFTCLKNKPIGPM